MISHELFTEIRRLFFSEHFTVNSICRELNLHADTIKRAIEYHQFSQSSRMKPRLIDPYVGFISQTLKDYPKITASRLYQMIKERGYLGSVRQVRRFIRKNRPRPHKAYLAINTMPGEQAQVDWGSFGKLQIGKASRKLSCFVMVLSHSRYLYAEFTFDQTLESFLRCHVRAFNYFGGIPRRILYDNLKACVIERLGKHIRYNPAILNLASHYHFKPTACNVAAGWEKGRVERSIRYIRDNFFTARHFKDLSDANRQIQKWYNEVANKRPWPSNDSYTVDEKHKEDLSFLAKLPSKHLEIKHVKQAKSGKTPYLRFDLNHYSIPHQYVGQLLTIEVDEYQVRVLDQKGEIASHLRSFDKGQRVEKIEHIKKLLEYKSKSRAPKGREKILTLIPESNIIFEHIAKHGGSTLGGSVTKLLQLMGRYGQEELRRAILEAIKCKTYKPYSVEAILLRNQRAQNKKVEIPLSLPDDPRINNQSINLSDLSQYNSLGGGCNDRFN